MNTHPINPIIVIPVYNGRDSLLKLVQQVKSNSHYPILVVNDGSTDGLCKEDAPGIAYLEHGINRGKGAALKSGLNMSSQAGFTHAITLDADGQHDPQIIHDFVGKATLNPGSIIVGQRDLVNVDMPLHRKVSNNITSMILSLRTGQRIYDSQVGYRCYPLNDSRLWISDEEGFQFESAVFFNVSMLKINLLWQSIPVIYSTEGSHMHLLKDTLRFVRTFFRSFKW